MHIRVRVATVLTLALLVSWSIALSWSMPAAASTSPVALEAARLQPPPEAPSAPPPGAGSVGEEPQEPYQPPSDAESDRSELGQIQAHRLQKKNQTRIQKSLRQGHRLHLLR